MDPLTVMRTIWRYKTFILPAMLVTLIAVVYVFQFGPRYFESNMSYAMVNPKLPTDKELDEQPQLSTLNKDNPFLRSSDPSLITEVVIARLDSSAVAESLKSKGLSADYTVNKGINGNGFVVTITGHGESEEQALATTRALGTTLEEELKTVQKINGADDRFLFTALIINAPDQATEQFSSRLRSVIMVLLGGAVLTFGAVSLARSLEARRDRMNDLKGASADGNAATMPDKQVSSLLIPAFSPDKEFVHTQASGPVTRRSSRTLSATDGESLSHSSNR
ncbi:chain-length determining protein [Pseudarthrobacter sp. LMD1-1-1.1]|uniref:chain-length determining protein n=1 Tax=Pseudarthrobacter sp. LMD1-1-1.1 TaxID=3135242 RepID=UPI003443FD40